MASTSSKVFTEKRIKLPTVGFETRLFVAGSGTPVLLLHGNPHSANQWRFLAEAMGGRGLVLAPDLPGFGESGEPPESFDYSREAHEAFINDVLDRYRQVGYGSSSQASVFTFYQMEVVLRPA